MYRQLLDLYATAVYYDLRSEISVEFFKIVQNKLHFAAHGNTATEVIFMRADADAPMMGLISFKGDRPTLRDAQIAKNCVYSCVYSVVYIVMSSPDDYISLSLNSCIFIANIHGDVSRFQNRHAGLMPSINDVFLAENLLVLNRFYETSENIHIGILLICSALRYNLSQFTINCDKLR